MIDTEAIRAQYPLKDMIEQLCNDHVEHHKIRCPFHNDGTPSLHVYDDGGWKCWGCGKSGDLLDFIGYFRYGDNYDPGTHFTEIVDSLGALDIKPLPPRTTKPAPPKPKLSIELDQILDWADTMPPHRRAYWHSRGLTDQTISEFMLGWNGSRYVIPAMYRLIPFSLKLRLPDEDMKAAVTARDAAIAQLRLSDPLLSENELDRLAPVLPRKYDSPKGNRPGIFNSDTLLDATMVIICEGEIDAMLLQQSGLRAVSSTGGAGTWKPEWARFFTHIPDVYILYDNDQAGKAGAHRVKCTIRRGKYLSLPPGVNDVGDLFQRYASDPQKALDYIWGQIGH